MLLRSYFSISVCRARTGCSIARQVRERWQCGLVILTGRGDAVDKVVGLEIGADDYITKPFDLRELVARIRAVLRRTASSTAAVGTAQPPVASPKALRFLDWTFDVGARRLLNPDGVQVVLTTGEHELLHTFLRHPGRVLSRDFLLEETRGREAGPFDRTIDVQVGRLRKKIEVSAEDPQSLKSVRGAGYIFVAPVSGR
jgi:DNA-binding response OmpR family regulator